MEEVILSSNETNHTCSSSVVLNVVEMIQNHNIPVVNSSDYSTKPNQRQEDEEAEVMKNSTDHNDGDKSQEIQQINVNKSNRIDSLDQEAFQISQIASSSTTKAVTLGAVMQLAFQSIGVVYGDIGTSPLYVFSSTFNDRIPTKNNIIGALSLIIYSLTLFPLIKYVLIVLRANDNGDGGTLAMYSLICREARVSAEPTNQLQGEDEMLSAYNITSYKRNTTPNSNLRRATRIKEAMERSSFAKKGLLVLALLGTCMVIGDGILTPCISVLSAVNGVKKIDAAISDDVVVTISVTILVVLFSIQRFGTDKVGYAFAPAVMLWYLFIGMVGIFNLFRHETTVLKAFNPIYIFQYFSEDPKQAWVSLGGVILCMTGTEPMYADLGHFSVRSIQIAFTALVYPCLISNYVGQAAYLSKFPNDVNNAFYKSTPDSAYWPILTTAVLASIIASQAMISATFSIVRQSRSLGCFPRVRVIHTSHKHEGQVYIPEINFLLMFASVLVTASFEDIVKIGNAYGVAVMAVMIVTTSLLALIMLMIWQTNILLIALFVLVFGTVEMVCFSSVLYKIDKGGYLPLVFATTLFCVMYVWHYVQVKRYAFEVEKKVSAQYLLTLGTDLGIARVPGVGLLYTELTQGIPSIFSHFLSNLPAIHSVLVFVSVKHLVMNKVPTNERFLLRRVGPKDYKMYRCIVRYGYRDRRVVSEEFENLLMEHLRSFIRCENWLDRLEEEKIRDEERGKAEEQEEEIEFLEKSMRAGVVYMLGHSEVKASEDSCMVKRFVVDYAYDFLRRNFRQGLADLQIPNENLIRVGMNYYI